MSRKKKPLLQKLEEYYRSQSIYSLDFRCSYFEDCSSGCDSFTEAKSAFVSSGYEQHDFPRFVVLSADPGSGWSDPDQRTPEFVRYHEEEIYRLEEGRINQHWYQTHNLVYQLIKPFKPDIRIEDAKHYFAHVNSAKCSVNNPQRAQAGDRLFKNCYRYVKGEIEVLEPDVIISQGDKAKQCVAALFDEIPYPEKFAGNIDLPKEVKLIRARTNLILWLQLYHPNQRQSFYQKKNLPKMPIYQFLIQSFMSQKNPIGN